MIKIIRSLTLLLTIFFISCNESKKESEKSEYETRWDKQKQLDTLNLKEAIKLSNSNNAILGWDTTNNFTYSLQELFENTQKPMSFIGTINDITKRDSIYVLKIANSRFQVFKTFNAEISVSPSMFNNLKLDLHSKASTEGCFIFHVTHITSNIPVMKSEVEPDGDNVEDATSFITLDFGETLIKIQGELIDFYLYDQLKGDNE